MEQESIITTSEHGFEEGDSVVVYLPWDKWYMKLLAWLHIVDKQKKSYHTITNVSNTNL